MAIVTVAGHQGPPHLTVRLEGGELVMDMAMARLRNVENMAPAPAPSMQSWNDPRGGENGNSNSKFIVPYFALGFPFNSFNFQLN